MALCVDWLQLLQSGFTASNTLYEHNIFIWLSHLWYLDAVERDDPFGIAKDQEYDTESVRQIDSQILP